MKTRMLRNIEVSEVGMGCMAFSHGYGRIPEEQYSIEAIRNAYEHGCTFFDTAEVYSPNLSGTGHNELIVGKALKGARKNVVIATKLMLQRGAGSFGHGFGSVYSTIRSHLEESLKRLRTDYVDIYYLHRMSSVPVEKIADAMGRLIDDGLIRGWGLSQVDVDVISTAHHVTPLAYDEFAAAGEGYQKMVDASAAERCGTSDEIAEAGAFLLGEHGGFITGTDLLIDGGVIAAIRTGTYSLHG